MAVIDEVPGVEVSILIDGQPVEEYEDTDEKVNGPLASKTVVKYIEVISDTEFTISFAVLPAFWEYIRTGYDLCFEATVDGQRVGGHARDFAKTDTSCPWNSQMGGVYCEDASGRATVKVFKFAAIQIGRFANLNYCKRRGC